MADPGFPVWGAPSCWGGADFRCRCFLPKTNANMKELDSVKGGKRASSAPLDPPMVLGISALRFLRIDPSYFGTGEKVHR